MIRRGPDRWIDSRYLFYLPISIAIADTVRRAATWRNGQSTAADHRSHSDHNDERAHTNDRKKNTALTASHRTRTAPLARLGLAQTQIGNPDRHEVPPDRHRPSSPPSRWTLAINAISLPISDEYPVVPRHFRAHWTLPILRQQEGSNATHNSTKSGPVH